MKTGKRGLKDHERGLDTCLLSGEQILSPLSWLSPMGRGRLNGGLTPCTTLLHATQRAWQRTSREGALFKHPLVQPRAPIAVMPFCFGSGPQSSRPCAPYRNEFADQSGTPIPCCTLRVRVKAVQLRCFPRDTSPTTPHGGPANRRAVLPLICLWPGCAPDATTCTQLPGAQPRPTPYCHSPCALDVQS